MFQDYQAQSSTLSAAQKTKKEDEIVAKEKSAAELKRKYFGPEGELAKMQEMCIRDRFNVAPNPMVGAVIVCDGLIIGEGYHIRCGEAHAEVNAIRSVKDKSLLSRSTIYVSLEPCSHYGKTPPCADLIIEKQIPRIVIGLSLIHI